MELQHCITWFKSNSDLANLIVYGDGFFAMDYVDNAWHVGYKYRDYEEDYFLESLEGNSEFLIDALQESYDKTCVVVRQLREILQGLRKPTEFKVGNPYITVTWGTDGSMIARELVCVDTDGGVFRHNTIFEDVIKHRSCIKLCSPTIFEEIE